MSDGVPPLLVPSESVHITRFSRRLSLFVSRATMRTCALEAVVQRRQEVDCRNPSRQHKHTQCFQNIARVCAAILDCAREVAAERCNAQRRECAAAAEDIRVDDMFGQDVEEHRQTQGAASGRQRHNERRQAAAQCGAP